MNWIVIVRASISPGDVICAKCDRPVHRYILVDGRPWATACRVHLRRLTNDARCAIGLKPERRVSSRRGKTLPRSA